MGGQAGGMVNEAGHFPEVCKKSFQAMVGDMQGGIPDDFFQTYSLAQLSKFTPYQMEHAGRLVKPLLLEKGSQHYQPITWGEAMERIVTKLRNTKPRKSFWYFSGRSSNEAGFLLQLFARLYGTNHVNNCSYYCHQASGVGLTSVIGTGAGTIKLDDLEKSDCVILIGGNPASNHPRMMRSLMMVRRRGGKVVVVNPMIETGLVNFSVPSDPVSLLFGTKIASTYVQPCLGGDLALIYGIMKRLKEMHALERGDTPEPIVDEEFLANHTQGWDALAERLESLSWDEIVEKSGATVDVSDDGTVTVAAPDEESRNKALQIIKDLTAKAELNKIYNGKVMKIMEFGAFVNFLGKQDGLVHISELAPKRVEKVTDVVKEGDEVKVKVIGFDRGKVKLSMKQAAE
mgnify:CR=1 FL=1